MAVYYKSGSSWVDAIHPVGCFYISQSATSPSTLFGGQWTQVTNAAIRAATGTGYTGSDTHTLTQNEMPNHYHYNSRDNDKDYGYSYNTSSGDRVYYGRYSSGGRPAWKITSSVGGGAAHSIVQRSYNCYVWYRTA